MNALPPRQLRSSLIELVEIVDDLAESPAETVMVVRRLLRRARFVRSGTGHFIADIDSPRVALGRRIR